MALAKQIVEFPLDLGLDTKTDPKRLPFGVLSVAENVIYETKRALRKRNGYDLISNLEFENTTLPDLLKLSAFKDELISFSEHNLYSYSESAEAWSDKGSIYSIVPTTVPVTRRNTQQNSPSIAMVSTFKVYAYEESAGGIYFSVIDQSNNSFIVSYELLDSNGNNPKIGVIGNTVYLIYNDSGTLKFKHFEITSPSSLSSEVTISAAYDNTVNRYDLVSYSDKVFVSYQSATGISTSIINSDNTVGTTSTLAGESCANGLDLIVDESGRLVLSFASATDLQYAIYPVSLLTTILAATVVETIVDLGDVTVIPNGNTYTFYYEITAASDTNTLIRTNTGTSTGTVGTASVFIRALNLSSKGFRLNDINYIPCLYSSTLQSTYFLLDENAKAVCKWEPGTAGALPDGGGLPKPVSITSTKLEFVGQSKLGLVADGETFYSSLGVISTVLDFDFSVKYENVDMASNKHIASGILQMYDGKNVVEHGFNVYPEQLSNVSDATVGGGLSDGTYGVKAVYAWMDNQGNLHRSSESLNFSKTLSGGTATQRFTVSIPTLRLTDKESVIIEVYRTEANGSDVWYKETTVNSPLMNNPAADSVNFELTIADSTLISREPLYTTGGILTNIAAPAAKYACTYQNRVVLLGLENPNAFIFSKINLNGNPVEFNDELQSKTKDAGGGITGGAELDDKLIIFKQTSIFYTSGEGPNNAGEQNDFNEPEIISSDVGCIDAKSIVLTPKGLMFKSLKGIYLLTSGLQLLYIGDKVERYNNYTITDVNVIGDLNQVRFLTDDNLCLVYNYDLNLWATFTNHAGLSSTTILADYYYLRTDSTIYKENRERYNDNGTAIKFKLVTGWFSLGEVQGFQRVYKMFLLGTYKSKHSLRVKAAYNFVDAYIQEKIIDVEDFLNTNTYGEDTPYGSSDPNYYGGTDEAGNRLQERIDFKKQKCQSIKLSIEDLQNEYVGEALSLSAITFEVGAKVGPFKIEANRQFGTE